MTILERGELDSRTITAFYKGIQITERRQPSGAFSYTFNALDGGLMFECCFAEERLDVSLMVLADEIIRLRGELHKWIDGRWARV